MDVHIYKKNTPRLSGFLFGRRAAALLVRTTDRRRSARRVSVAYCTCRAGIVDERESCITISITQIPPKIVFRTTDAISIEFGTTAAAGCCIISLAAWEGRLQAEHFSYAPQEKRTRSERYSSVQLRLACSHMYIIIDAQQHVSKTRSQLDSKRKNSVQPRIRSRPYYHHRCRPPPPRYVSLGRQTRLDRPHAENGCPAQCRPLQPLSNPLKRFEFHVLYNSSSVE